ncbi:hypothetical protein SAMN05880590_101366 [Rhizobium sp. RU35A]|uniref:hypothetical protein n=1 Tax=Rhizobium sp. RU35A TaxID=1907414 RepID=UPI000954D0C7|nr:hypothetical protein [Rhizobium sp. RU35A]SIP94616.1 hypothetical protein SAMN05880590_101366 [Rhizobium sp. RU35A]
MTTSIDLSTFKPKTADELFSGILANIVSVLKNNVEEIKKEISVHLQSLAKKAWLTQLGLAKGTITRENADIAIHTQELALSNVLLLVEFMTYELVQDVIDAAFSVVSAAIKNLTGIELKF